jgi:hypothetical protein
MIPNKQAKTIFCKHWTLPNELLACADTVIIEDNLSGNMFTIMEMAISALKSGGMLFIVCISSNYHKYAYEIENRGLDIRDCIFMLDTNNNENSRLVAVAGKPYDKTFYNNAIKHGVAGFWINGSRIGDKASGWNGLTATGNTWNKNNCGLRKTGKPSQTIGKYPSNIVFARGIDDFMGEYFDVLPNKNSSNLFEFLCRLSKTPNGGNVVSIPGNDVIMAAAIASGREYVGIISVNE